MQYLSSVDKTSNNILTVPKKSRSHNYKLLEFPLQCYEDDNMDQSLSFIDRQIEFQKNQTNVTPLSKHAADKHLSLLFISLNQSKSLHLFLVCLTARLRNRLSFHALVFWIHKVKQTSLIYTVSKMVTYFWLSFLDLSACVVLLSLEWVHEVQESLNGEGKLVPDFYVDNKCITKIVNCSLSP